MDHSLSGRTTIIALFRRFYAELLTCRARAIASASMPASVSVPVPAPPMAPAVLAGAPPLSGPPLAGPPLAGVPPVPPAAPAAPAGFAGAKPSSAMLAEDLSDRLVQLLETLGQEAARTGGPFAAALFADAKYAMAALGDDVFLSLDWPGRQAWKSVLLEQRLFNSYVAGEALFQRIDRLFQQPDGGSRDLAAVYLAVLGLGFEGKFRAHDSRGEVTEYRLRLHRLLAKGRPLSERVSGRAYERLISSTTPKFLPTARAWYWAIGGVVGLFLVVSHIVWAVNTGSIAEDLGAARAAIENLGTSWPN
mgnify:CR=1 FL=1